MKRFAVLAACLPVILLASTPLASCGTPRPAGAPGIRLYEDDSPPADVEVIMDVEYGRAGDVSLRLNVIRPKARADKPRPAILWIHGGGWAGGSKDASTGMLCGFAQKGYVCASVQYRFVDAARFPAQIEDCKCAVRFLRAHAEKYGIDPDRIGAWGNSSGGHLAALLATSGGEEELEGSGGWQEQSSAVNAACDWYGPVCLAGATLHESHPYSQLLGAPPQDNPALARLSDPASFISADDPGILIMHGDSDGVVPISLSEQFFDRLTRGGVEAELEIVKGAGHGEGFWENPDVYAKVLDFFDRKLK